MKTIRIAIILIIAASMSIVFSACSDPAISTYERSDTVKITFVDNGHFRVRDGNAEGNTFYVKTGEDLTATVEPDVGWFLSRSDYAGSRIMYGKSAAKITLPAVSRSQRVRLTFLEASGTIIYDANGGDFLRTGENVVIEPYDLSHHIRQNTNIGNELVRDGYTLTGWNTAPDGGGEHIGLGSRVSVNEGETVSLYAEWIKWSDESDFVRRPSGDGSGALITGYAGNSDAICVPAELDGLPVTQIKKDAFVGASAETVVLPGSIATVERQAFRNCALKELYLSDNIEGIWDESFSDCPYLETLHINAVEPPKWTDYDRHSNLSDKYDILIKRRTDKKIVVFGGSGSYFSVDTKQMTDALADRGYVVINMAVNANFNAYMQFGMIEPYMRAGDILIHIPETGSAQMMAETRISDVRIWHGLESNFDLVSLIDIRGVDNIFDSFTSFNVIRSTRKNKTYADYVRNIDELGNWAYEDSRTGELTTYKKERGTDTPFTYEAVIKPEYLAGEAAKRRKAVYGKFSEKGVRVFLSNAALNADGLSFGMFGGGGDEAEKLRRCYEFARGFDALNEQTFPEYAILVGISECLYAGGRFFNSDYHLGSPAAAEHTRRLTENLERYLN